jgi:methionine-S-sulfoxide reductase
VVLITRWPVGGCREGVRDGWPRPTGSLRGERWHQRQKRVEEAEGGGLTVAEAEVATFAGGCFWCMVHPFDEIPGVLQVVSGYTGGSTPHPTYEEVCGGRTGHREAVAITFDPERVSYATLLDRFWRQIDPTDADGQFYDRGPSYRTAIYYHTDAQRELAEASKRALAASGRFDRPIVMEILPAGPFYPAEDYHQAFYRKNPTHYRRYREGSGRDRFLALHWRESDKGDESRA